VESDAPVDRWNSSQMQIPGVFFLESGFAPAGSEAAKAQDKEACKKVPGVHWFENIQIMTPETDRTSHFFFDYMHQFGPERNDVTLSLYDSMWEGFNEDINIITHQQEILDRDPDFEFRAIANDGALSHFRWALGKLIEAEQHDQPIKAVA
jgi:vanillate O-demethylase monooxygenase subunit